MSEQQSEEGSQRPPITERPRRPDGSFMTNKEYDEFVKSQRLEQVESRQKESMSHLVDSNKALMRGTGFTEDSFKGMDALAINKFLTNYHDSRQGQAPPEGAPKPSPNTPIIGTPVGSGRREQPIDPFISIDPKKREIEFEAPASLVYGIHSNRQEAKRKWWVQQ